MTRWFGASWGAPVCDPKLHVATPVGEKCQGHDHCHADRSALIEPGDQGITMPYVPATGAVVVIAYHLDCWLHEVGADRLVSPARK